MFWPSRRTETRPTSFKTRRCLDTDGCPIPSASTISPTVRSSNARNVRMSRRRGSATALKASEVVVARGMKTIYTHIGIYKNEKLGSFKRRSDQCSILNVQFSAEQKEEIAPSTRMTIEH